MAESTIRPIQLKDIEAFRDAVGVVRAERRYLLPGPPSSIEKASAFLPVADLAWLNHIWYVSLIRDMILNGRSQDTTVFFCTDAGNEPVRAWLKDLPEAERREIGQDLMRVQWRWPVGMPLCRSLGSGLWEVRSHLPSNRIARVIFCAHGGELVALHGFVKKSQKAPKADVNLAGKRRKELDGDAQ